MIKSINTWAFDPARPLQESLSLAKAHGFEGVELTIAQEGALTPESTLSDCRQVRAMVSAAGLHLSGVASGLGWAFGLLSSDAQERAEAVRITAACLRVGQGLEAGALLVVPGSVTGATEPGGHCNAYDAAYDNALDSLSQLKSVAEECGVALAIENVWNKFLLSPLEFRGFVDAAASPQIGCYFDVGNVLPTGFPEQWIHILGKRVKRVHFKDYKREVGTLAGFCALLEGDVNYPAVMAALRTNGYDGPVTAEFFDCEADLPAISVAMDRILMM